jgi:NADPH:quinone reductase-like Zn-dependent oxidoreductase
MTSAVRFYGTGGPEVLKYESVALREPGPGEVHIRHVAVGLNYADTYFRTGYYPAPLPSGIGVEASGTILAVGPGVMNFSPGDRVTYTGSPLGAYSTERVMPVDSLIKLPDTIAYETAAAMTMRGLTAAYLLRRICPTLKAGDTILVHAAAGGLGLILTQWAKLLRLNVIGTVSSAAKAALALRHGCDHVIYYGSESVPDRVRALTRGAGAAVVYDTVGKDTFEGSLNSLRRRGMLVCVGTSSGPIPPIDALQLAIKGSLYVTRPALADYIAEPNERAALAYELFEHVGKGRIKVEIMQHYTLSDAVQAHRDLESRKTTGSSIFVI